MISFYDYLNIDGQYKLDKEIPLRFFYKNGRMTEKAKSRFLNTVQRIAVKYEITEQNSLISPLFTLTSDYEEYLLMEVQLNKKIDKRIKIDVCRNIFQTITYPMILILNVDDIEYELLSFSFHKPKRSRYNSVVDTFFSTYWINLKNIRNCDTVFFSLFSDVMDFKNRNYHNFGMFHEAVVNCLPIHRDLVKEEFEKRKKPMISYVNEYGFEYTEDVQNWLDKPFINPGDFNG